MWDGGGGGGDDDDDDEDEEGKEREGRKYCYMWNVTVW